MKPKQDALFRESSDTPLGPRTWKQKGSFEWIDQTLSEVRTTWSKAKQEVAYFERLLEELEETHAYKLYPPDNPAGNLDALLAQVLPVRSVREATDAYTKRRAQALADDPDVTAHVPHGGEREGAGRPPTNNQPDNIILNNTTDNQPDNIILNNNNHGYGTSAEYIVRRLKRDHPHIALALAKGEFSSARAAGKAAGFVKDKTPLQHVQTGWRHATLNDKRHIVAWIQDRLQEDQELLDTLGS